MEVSRVHSSEWKWRGSLYDKDHDIVYSSWKHEEVHKRTA